MEEEVLVVSGMVPWARYQVVIGLTDPCEMSLSVGGREKLMVWRGL